MHKQQHLSLPGCLTGCWLAHRLPAHKAWTSQELSHGTCMLPHATSAALLGAQPQGCANHPMHLRTAIKHAIGGGTSTHTHASHQNKQPC